MSTHKKNQKAREQSSARKPTADSAQNCNQRWCDKPVWRDAVCKNCWVAIYGGVL